MAIIAGVNSKGKLKGKAIEVPVGEKPYHALKKGICDHAPSGESWWIEDVKIDGDVDVKPLKTNPLRKTRHGYFNNSYQAKGKVVIRRMNIKTDKLGKKFTKDFEIICEDHLDEQGLPDVKIKDLKLS